VWEGVWANPYILRSVGNSIVAHKSNMREPLLLSPSNNRGVLLREKGEEGETLLLSYNDGNMLKCVVKLQII
jgi:hypothetical protein